MTDQKENKPVAFEELHDMFRGALLRFFLRRMTDRAIVEDLVQQVFEKLLPRRDSFVEGNLDSYVFRVARSVLTDHFRQSSSRRRDAHDPFDETAHAGVDFSPEYVLANRESLARAVAALQTLPERTRAIFVMRRLDGMKHRDIAARFGISVSAVEKHMERAMARLAKDPE